MIFKHRKEYHQRILFTHIHPILLCIFLDANRYTYEKYGVYLEITSTISTLEEDLKYGRVSQSHRRKAAIDFTQKSEIMNDVVNYINSKREFTEYKYLSHSGINRLAYRHNNGNGDHVHLALHSKYFLDDDYPIKGKLYIFLESLKKPCIHFFQKLFYRMP